MKAKKIPLYDIGDIIQGNIYFDSDEVVTYLIEDIKEYEFDEYSFLYCVRDIEHDEIDEFEAYCIDNRDRFIKVG